MKKLILPSLLTLVSGCQLMTPHSTGENVSGFTYIPLDPLQVSRSDACPMIESPDSPGKYIEDPNAKRKKLLDALPDNAVRVAIKEITSNGNVSFGPSTIGVSGGRYQVILDYINADTANVPFFIEYSVTNGVPKIGSVFRADSYSAKDTQTSANYVIPIYVGVGLRLTADIQVIRGEVSLASLSSIAAGVESGMVSGSLVVQTLGITGKQVSAILPLPSELNQTTVQNAVQSLGAIKAIMYDTDTRNVVLTERVTGMYLPIGQASVELVNKIVSELARENVMWRVGCNYNKEVKS